MKASEVIQTAPRWIELERIECAVGPYCMSFGFDLEPLMQSIRAVGLVNAPLLMKNEHGRYDVISGFRRIQAVRFLGWEKILGRSLSRPRRSPLECLLLNLYDNLATRKLNDVEKGMVLKRLSPLLSENELLAGYMPLLDLRAHAPILNLYLRIENELEWPIKESLARGHLSMQVAGKLLDLEGADRAAVFKLISILKFNVNEQNQVIDYMNDISKAEKKPTVQLCNQISREGILSDSRMNTPQKAKAILKRLRAQRFPRLQQAEAVFKKRVSTLRLPKGVKISAPPYFESPDYQLQVTFRDGGDLEAKIEQLFRIKSLKSLKNPWEQGV
ncbi:MAG: ParB N-terminal domain-containing protein [Desulfatiglandaceae bacterium]